MNIKKVLDNQLEKVKLSNLEFKEIENKTDELCSKIAKELKKRKIQAKIFVGGSLAKKTLMRKQKYDIDIFVRFDKKYKNEEISELLKKTLKKAKKVHGSRDYFQIQSGNIIYEIVPVTNIPNPKQMRNITDLSYFHVSYVKGKINKNKKLADDIILAKSFCYSNKIYGAESYIHGFSGYALELLTIQYKGFLNFLKQTSKAKTPIVLDPRKFYKNKQEVLNNMNEAKLSSPIIFVDPTFKERNALAALSNETFEKFKKIAKQFIKKPSVKFFEEKKINPENYNLIIKIKTNKQSGDIAGSKLYKFHRFLLNNLDKNFELGKNDFEYDEKKTGSSYFNISEKKQLIKKGPPLVSKINVVKFKKKYKKTFIKKGILYTQLKPLTIKQFLTQIKTKYKKILKEMSIVSLN